MYNFLFFLEYVITFVFIFVFVLIFILAKLWQIIHSLWQFKFFQIFNVTQ